MRNLVSVDQRQVELSTQFVNYLGSRSDFILKFCIELAMELTIYHV